MGVTYKKTFVKLCGKDIKGDILLSEWETFERTFLGLTRVLEHAIDFLEISRVDRGINAELKNIFIIFGGP